MSMIHSSHDYTKSRFVNTLALLILEDHYNGKRNDLSEYRKGWLEGFAKGCETVTGLNIYQLVERANDSIKGSGFKLEM